MPVAPHIVRLRERVGHDLLLLPSVAVLPTDDAGRVLLVRQTDFGAYGTIGGAIDEVDAAKWFARSELIPPDVGEFALNTFRAVGWLRGA